MGQGTWRIFWINTSQQQTGTFTIIPIGPHVTGFDQSVLGLTNMYGWLPTDPLITNKTSNCVFTGDDEFDNNLINYGEWLLLRTL